ncbi:MAG: hypothetical protein ACI383_00315 [Rummeliibacillus sp.]
MGPRLSVLIDFTREKFGLEQYNLHHYSFSRTIDLFKNTYYTLCMEWFPDFIDDELLEEGLNPEGAAVIEIDINSYQTKSAIFVGGKSYSNQYTFSGLDTREIIHWVEEQTNLTFNKQFHLVEVEKGRLYFKSCLNGQEVSPFGDIELKYDYDGRIIFFSVNGHFPNLDLQVKEDYTLSLEKIDELKRAQLKLIDYPSAIYKKLIEIYAVEEIYIKNDLSTIPYEVSLIGKEHLKIDKIITWESRLSDQFERKEIAIIEEIPEELAFSGESHPDLIPISEQEREKCEIAVTNFLRQQYPFDSGNWKLSELCRDKGYIHAILAGSEKKSCVLQRKLLLIIDRVTLEVLNYLDNKFMLETFDLYRLPERIVISEEDAYEKLKDYFELKPTFVYDHEQKQYILCGKLDCAYGINASTGEIIELNNL